MTQEEQLRALRGLEWTEEVRPSHPWFRDILVRRSEVEAIIKGEQVERAPMRQTPEVI